MRLNLTIGRKLAAAFLLFLAPVAFLLFYLVEGHQRGIRTAQNEQAGVTALRPAIEAYAAVVAAGRPGASPGDAELGRRLADLQASLGALPVDAVAQAGRRALAAAAPFAAGRAAGDGAAVEAASGEFGKLIKEIGDGSELILDPELDSYYVMDSLVVRAPELLALAAEIAAVGREALAAGQREPRLRFELQRKAADLRRLIEPVRIAVDSAVRHARDAGVKPALEGPSARLFAAADDLGRVVEGAAQDGAATPRGLYEALGRFEAALVAYAAAAAPELSRLLQARIEAVESRRLREIAITGVLFLAGIGLVGVFVRRDLTGPVSRLTATMTALAADRVDVDVEGARRGDEIGAMARAVLVFRDNAVRRRELEAAVDREAEERRRQEAVQELLAGFERSLASLLDVIDRAGAGLDGSARSLTRAAEETMSRSQSVARGSQGTAAAVSTVASAAEELAGTIGEIAGHARRSADVATGALEQAQATEDAIAALAALGREIGNIVELIGSIAAQTNLLALNATIEAARAGEAGRGFAVVAAEVKALASQTQRATGEIQGQIAAIQGSVATMTGRVAGIVGTIRNVHEAASQIEARVDEQGRATDEIARAAADVATSADGMVQVIDDLRSTAEVTRGAGEQVLSASRELGLHAGQLKAEVASFFARISTLSRSAA